MHHFARLTFVALLAALVAGCGSGPETASKDEPHAGNFADVRISSWRGAGGAAHVSERTCSDGALITREHLVANDEIHMEPKPFWADLTLESLADGRTSRAFLTAGLGHEPSNAPSLLTLERTDSGRWKRFSKDGSAEELEALDGCEDLEIAGDHVTAGLAIKRLKLNVGETRDFDRVLSTLPGMDLSRVKRRLTRIDDQTWKLEELNSEGAPQLLAEVYTDKAGAVEGIAVPVRPGEPTLTPDVRTSASTIR